MVQIRAMVTRPAASIPMSSPKTPSTRDIKSSAAATEQQSAPPRHAVKPGCPPGLNKYSSKITQPKSQGASQAMLYATGLSEEDMNKPQVKRWPIGKEEEEKFDR
jgi:dihydroxy-acid dehydratase